MHRSLTESWIPLVAAGMLLVGGSGCVGSGAPTEGGHEPIGEDWWSADDDDDAVDEPAGDPAYEEQEPDEEDASCTYDCEQWCASATMDWCDGNFSAPCECGETGGPADEPAPGNCTNDCSVWCEDLTTSWCDDDGSAPCVCGGGSDECQPSCDLWANSAITCQDGVEVVDACPRGWTCSFVDAQGRHVESADVPSSPACLSCEDAGQLSCDDGSGCYYADWVCDGYRDCENESDETDC